jgi:phosphoribosylglycinamide formyltransferase 2
LTPLVRGLPVDASLRSPAASAVIYGQREAKGIAFEGAAEALAVPGTDIRLFGKPESFARRRRGVALALADDVAARAARRALPPERSSRYCREWDLTGV